MKELFEYFRLWNKTKQEVVLWDYNKFPDGQLQLKIAKKNFDPTNEYVLYASIPDSEALDLYNQFLRLSRSLFTFHDRFKSVILYAYGSRCDKPENEDDLLVTFTTMFQHADYTLVPHAKQIYQNTIFEPDIENSSKLVKLPYAKSSTLLELSSYDLVVFPDESAKARYPKIAAKIKKSVVCEKVRDQETGEIISHALPDDFPTETTLRVLVMDDLCDGGKTFINVSDLIEGYGPATVDKIDLFITHGVFSNDALNRLNSYYDHIYVTNSLPWVEQHVEVLPAVSQERVTVINVWNDYD